MSGHSKWSTIKHQKARTDAKRGKVFTKIIRDLMTAARMGGGDVNSNSSLRLAVDLARKENMPKDTMERAIKRGTGEIEGADYVEKTYEGYAPNGVAVIVKTLTDNGTRTVTNVRTAFNKNGGNMGNDGTVAWMFEEKGVIIYDQKIGDEDSVMEIAIESGADDFEPEGEIYKVITAVSDFGTVRDALEEKYGKAIEADLSYIPTQMQAVETAEQAESVLRLVAALDDDDDVQDVTINMDMPEEVAAKLSA
jgi:YebC/PmpR family DNA-binding regulatory protein